MSAVDIDVGLNLEATPDSLRKLHQDTQKAATVYLQQTGANATQAGAGNAVSGQGASMYSQLAAGAGKVTQTMVGLAKGIGVVGAAFGAVAGAIGITVTAVKGAEKAWHAIREAITASSYNIDRAINSENARLAVMKIQLDYTNRLLQSQTSYNQTMLESNRLIEEADRKQAERSADIQKNAEAEKADVQKRSNNIRQDNEAQVNFAMTRLNGGGLLRDLASWNNRRTTQIGIGGEMFRVERDRGWLGGVGGYSERGKIIDSQGNRTVFENRAQMQSLIEQLVKGANQKVDQVENKRNAEIETEQQKAEDTNIKTGERDRAFLEIQMMRRASSTQLQADREGVSNVDAAGYAIRMTQVNEEYAARERYNKKYEELRLKAADEGRTAIEKEDADRIQRTLDSELRAISVKARANENIAKAYSEIMDRAINRNTSGLAAGQEWERNMSAVLKIEQQYRQEVEKAKTAEELSVAETQRKTALTAEQLKNQVNLRTVQAQDDLRRSEQAAARNQSELGITSKSNVAAESAQTISDFRIKLFEGMRAGTMSAMDFQIAGIEKTYSLQMSREKALHDQKMQDLKDYESQQEQRINLEYEEATQADRQRIAELSKMLQDPNISASQRQAIEYQLQQSQGNISTAENTRRESMDELRTNARGSVRAEAAFKENMSKAEARHREQVSYLKAIATNTGKVVTDVAASYKETSAQFYGRSNLAMFGMSASPFSTPVMQSPAVLADQRMLAILEMIARNTYSMRNYTNTARYA
jgi:hypothetical protein